MLQVSFDFIPNVIYKWNRFFKILLKKNFEFVLYKKNNLVLLNLSLMLLLTEVDPISENPGHEKNAFIICGTNCVEIILILLTKIVIFYM